MLLCNQSFKPFFLEECEAWLLYISTDYVFDGKNAPYRVDDIPNPLNTYGKLKLAGEKATMNCSTSKITILFLVLLSHIIVKIIQTNLVNPDL